MSVNEKGEERGRRREVCVRERGKGRERRRDDELLKLLITVHLPKLLLKATVDSALMEVGVLTVP
jgi:hypothetical protein